MFEGDLDELGTAALLAAASEFDRVEERAAVRKLEAALAFADRNAVCGDTGAAGVLPGTEQLRVYGGVGCPGVAEFAPIEFGAVMRMSTGAAAAFIGEALALRHRLPRIWAAVLAGNAMPWRARKIAHACLSLSVEAAAIVDRRVVGIVNTVTPGKLATIVKAAVWEADPELAKAAAELAAKERGVFVGPSDHHGTKRFWVRAAAGDVIRFDATIDDLARALKTLGDRDSLDQRRAKAIGWIADPAAARQLLEVARYLARLLPHISTLDDPAQDTADARRITDEHRSGLGGCGEGGGLGRPTQDPPTDPGQARPECQAPDGCQAADRLASDDSRPPDDCGADNDCGAADDAGAGADRRLAYHRCASDDLHDPDDRSAADDWSCPDDGPGPDDWRGSDEQDAPLGTGDPCAADCETARGPECETDCETDDGDGADAFTRRMLAGTLPARLAAIKQHAYSHGLAAGSGGRGNRHTLYVHLTDQTLATGNGVIRVEELGPLLLNQLTELLGHDQIVVRPVIDLHDQVSVHSYEIPDRIRERVRLRHPVDMFPYSGAEATTRMDQDHITPYDRAGPPAQTSTDNLIPQGRLHHRAKTFGGWKNRRLPTGAIEWTSPHGYRFRVDHTGTHSLLADHPG